jgi:hypothetical protein
VRATICFARPITESEEAKRTDSLRRGWRFGTGIEIRSEVPFKAPAHTIFVVNQYFRKRFEYAWDLRLCAFVYTSNRDNFRADGLADGAIA